MFLEELHEKHLVDDAVFLVDGTPWLQVACTVTSSDSSTKHTGIETASKT